MSLQYPDLLKKCDEVYETIITYVVTTDQAKLVKSKSKLPYLVLTEIMTSDSF